MGINKALAILEVQVPEATCDSQEAKYKFSLIGNFVSVGPRLRTDMVRDWITAIWKGVGPVNVSTRAGEVILFQFSSEEDMTKTLIGGP